MESWAGPGYEAVKYLWILVDEFNNSILVAVCSFNILYFEFCWDLALKTWLKALSTHSKEIYNSNHTHWVMSYISLDSWLAKSHLD